MNAASTLRIIGLFLVALGVAVFAVRSLVAYVTGQDLGPIRAATGVALSGLVVLSGSLALS